MVCEGCSQQGNAEARFCCHCGRPMGQTPVWNSFAGRLVRPREGRMISGVCLGIAQAYGFDPVLVRILAVLVLFAGCGSVLIAYIAAWIIMPNAPLGFVNACRQDAPPAGFAGSAPLS